MRALESKAFESNFVDDTGAYTRPEACRRPWFAEMAEVMAAVRGAAGRACSALWWFAWRGSPARFEWADRQARQFRSGADRALADLLLGAVLVAVSLAGMALAAAFGTVYLTAWAAEASCRAAAGREKPGAAREGVAGAW